MDILEEIHVVQHELGRHVILEGDDVRVVDGAMGMVFLDERSIFKDRRGQRGSKGDGDKKQGNGNTSHGGQKQPAHSEFISKLLIRIWLLRAVYPVPHINIRETTSPLSLNNTVCLGIYLHSSRDGKGENFKDIRLANGMSFIILYSSTHIKLVKSYTYRCV